MSPVIEHTRSGLQHRTVERPRAAGSPDRFLITSPAPDAYHDVVNPLGGDLTRYRNAGMPLFYSHDVHGSTNADGMPVGALKGLEVTPDGIWGTGIRWAKGDAFAARVKNLWDQDLLTGFSIGFFADDWTDNRLGGKNINRWTLVEVSIVGVPANPETIRAVRELRSLRPARAVDPAAFARQLAANIIAVLAARREQLSPRAQAGGVLLLDDPGSRRVSVTASDVAATIRDAFESARRR